jgi:hypothetical protein
MANRLRRREYDFSLQPTGAAATAEEAAPVPVDIGPEPLLLSHAPSIGVVVGASAIPFFFFVAVQAGMLRPRQAQLLSILWCAFSILMAAWTIYAISGTWQKNARLANPTYGSLGFLALVFLCLFAAVLNIILLVELAITFQ